MYTRTKIPLLAAGLFAALLIGACNSAHRADDSSTNGTLIEELEHPVNGAVPPAEPAKVKQQPAAVDATGRMVGKSEAKRQAYVAGAMAPMPAVPGYIRQPSAPLDRENYAHLDQNGVKLVSSDPVSTFSIDVDTGSYANVRRMLNEGRLPPQDAVRIEEMINYFSYDYQAPKSLQQPFRVTAEAAPAPWDAHKQLLQIGIKGYELDRSRMPAANLVFLVDVSGSMQSADKLPLLKSALKMLSRQLTAQDRISLVVYAGASGVVLEPTPGNQLARISSALDMLQAGGSTNGGDGIRLAYAMAEQAFIKGGINRVILATDGDFNVGTTSFESLVGLVEQKRQTGITLTTLGFGTGNYNDKLMEQLADKGNGNYAYIDTINEARKVLVDEVGSTLMTIAKDVKIQIEFNPEIVAEYRLIGYENRMLNREDFNNDRVDAGEIGAGHTVTALYELTLKGQQGLIDPLRYGSGAMVGRAKSGELAFLRLRYKQPQSQAGSDKSRLLEYPLPVRMIKKSLRQASDNFRFAASVAAFGDLLRGGKYSGNFGYDDLLKLARGARGNDRFGYRGEFLGLVRTAASLDSRPLAEQRHDRGKGDDIVIE